MIVSEKTGLASERLAWIRSTAKNYIGDDKITCAVKLGVRGYEIAHLECR